MSYSTGVITRPQRVVIYGPEGIGKSSLAALFPKPLFLDTEKGTEHLPVSRLDITTWDALIAAIDSIIANARGFQTIVIDTADWAERLATAKVLATANVKSIEDFGYGKGYTFLAEEWAFLLHKTRELRDRGLNVVFVAHSAVRKTELPDEAGSFDRYVLKLTATPKNDLSALLKEWADAVLFLNYKTHVTTDKNLKSKATGGKERVMYTAHTAALDAKNRWGLAPEIQGKDVAAIYASIAPRMEAIPAPTAHTTPVPTMPDQPALKPETQPAAVAAQAAAAVPPQQPIVKPTSDSFPSRLFDAMALCGIADAEMKAYLVGKGFIPPESSVNNLPDTFVTAMLATDNWNKITAAIAANRKAA